MIFAEIFRAWGMEASECASAGAALPALELTPRNQKEFDLIILHRIMPEVKGFDLVAQIHETSPNLPILITMSENIPADRIRDHQLGIAGYILKPVRRDELLRLVCNVLGAPASVQEQEERTAILNSARQDSAATRAFKILVAEDSDDNRFLVQEYLKNQPYQITFVENGEEAVMMARAQPFDLILMDILMPVMDGLTAAKLIRKAEQEDGRDCVPVVALTANAHQQDIEASRAAGCDSHLTKPISKETLLRAIAEYSRRQPAEAPVLPGSLSIDVPPGLEAAAKHYIAARKAEVPRLMNLAAGHDFDQLRVLAHNVKGTGTSYGFPELTRLAKLIESSAKERNESALPAQLLELSEYVQKAEQAVSALPSPRSA
jgi:CheY-like chemotaxis protein/HPt (histidine-containing phosphotransfer) domain-containing protein